MPEPSEPETPTPATTVEGALVAVLLNDSGVTAITSNVYPFDDSQSVSYPKITYHRWGTGRGVGTGGFSNDGPTGHAVAKLYVDCWAIDKLAAKQLAVAIRNAVNGLSGVVGNVTIGVIQVVDERDQPGALVPGQEKAIQRVTLDVRIQFHD